MDPYEATKKVFSRIQTLDPENSSKIMGLLLIQDHGEKEMIRLAFGPESLLQSVVLKARQELGISPNTPRVSPPWIPSNFHSNSDEIDEIQLQEQLSFLNEPPQQQDDPLAGGVVGWKPCLYFARGFCKNGSTCRFLHGGSAGCDFDSGSSMVGSPSKIEMMEQCHELLRSKSMQHQKIIAASQLMASRANSFSYSGSKNFNFLVQQQQNEYQRAAAALIMGEDINKLTRSRLSRNDFLMNGGGQIDLNHSSRQIYLTFPADSIFREEDVSNYFSIYGPVHDVRIPYQQKRMFGFVTFVYSDTVKIILAKGNPHFVCDSRVLVKPYKEKGKIPDKFRKQQLQLQQMERGDFSACNSPTGLDSRDPFENQLGSRMMYNNNSEEALWRRKLEEEADLQHAIELHSKRLMNLQLDVKRSQHQRALSAGAAPFPSPVKVPSFNQLLNVTDCAAKENATQITQQAVNDTDRDKDESGKDDHNEKGSSLSNEVCSLPESVEHNLPDSPFASPTKAFAKNVTPFTNASHLGPGSPSSSLLSSSLLPATSSLDLSTSFKSCYFQMPRFPAGHGAIGM